MQIEGLHLVPYLIAFLLLPYAALIAMAWANTLEQDYLRIKSSKKAHTAILAVGLLLVLLSPIRFTTQSDAQRTAVRHSFDTPVYESTRPVVEVQNSTQVVNQIRQQGGRNLMSDESQ